MDSPTDSTEKTIQRHQMLDGGRTEKRMAKKCKYSVTPTFVKGFHMRQESVVVLGLASIWPPQAYDDCFIIKA